MPDTAGQKVSFKFINTSDLIIQVAPGDKTVYNYKLIIDDNNPGETLLLIESTTREKNYSLKYSIEKLDDNILRLVSLDSYDVIPINI